MVSGIDNKRGDRIREERSRLNLSQEQFAALFSKKKMAVFRYEKGERLMTHEDLEMLYDAGVDVWYLITGERCMDRKTMSQDAHDLLELIKKIDQDQLGTLMILIKNFADSFPMKTS